MKTNMELEILSQREVLLNSIRINEEKLITLGKIINENKPNKIILVARGSSFNACTYFKYYEEMKMGIPVVYFAPSVITSYDAPYDFSNSLVIGVSQSGQALDCKIVMEEAKKQNAYVVSITNFEDSPMAKIADMHLFLNVGVENSVAATKTFTGEMLVLKGIVDYALNNCCNQDKVVKCIENAISLENTIKEVANAIYSFDQIIILARGLSSAIANEISLKLQETSYINARSYSLSDFHHGPFALTNDNSKFIIIDVDNKTHSDSVQMVKKIRETKANITLITNNDELSKYCDHTILLDDACKCILPFGAVTIGQLLALNISLLKELNPDSPRGLNKVTITK